QAEDGIRAFHVTGVQTCALPIFQAAIAELRKGSKVTGAGSEETYNSLEKFARNLNQAAKSGKLDPVIGRDEEIRRVLHILSRRRSEERRVGKEGSRRW